MSLQNISFPGEKIKYITPTWDEMNELAWKLSRQLIQDNKQFDRIVTLAKGGWPMARTMVDLLQLTKVASIGVKFYRGIYQKLDRPEIYQDLPESIKGENILLFDDCADSGGSLKFVKQHLEKNGSHTVTTAVLLYKPWSVIKPDYYGAQTTAWIIFPYERQETLKTLTDKWQDLPQAEVRGRLCKLLGKKIAAGTAA
jgi:hypoxanthine phosphoribosyltransferase